MGTGDSTYSIDYNHGNTWVSVTTDRTSGAWLGVVKTDIKPAYKLAGTCLGEQVITDDIIDHLLGECDAWNGHKVTNVIKGSIDELRMKLLHHSFGPTCWCFDVDEVIYDQSSILVEHRPSGTRGDIMPVALVEYKREQARQISILRRQFLRKTADFWGINAYMVTYTRDIQNFEIRYLDNELEWVPYLDVGLEELTRWHQELGKCTI